MVSKLHKLACEDVIGLQVASLLFDMSRYYVCELFQEGMV